MFEAAEGLVKEIAFELGLTTKRVYELLGKDDSYPKVWRLLRVIGRLNKDRLRRVRADFNARCDASLENDSTRVTCAEAHREFSEALQCWLEDKPVAQQRKELIEARLVIEHRLDELSRT